MSDEEIFQLEKRAFFSKTWLFVCHQSRFAKPGDYHAFDVAGISFFVVLGKDMKLRGFHNVCRHRAYTVVRKSCGTSTRFSCKYHGWQYDDTGALVKAPKFDESPGFVPAENGLFEIKLIATREGLVFVNFDASTLNLPFNNVKSHVDLGDCSWADGMEVTCGTNWKTIANEFSDQAQWSQSPFGWFSALRKSKIVRLLGPLTIIKELDDDLWCTMVLLPRSSSEVIVRCDLYAKEGHVAPVKTLEKWKWMLKQELMTITRSGAEEKSSTSSKYFAYQCGGRTIDLFAILAQHQRSEKMAKRKVQPAIRVTSTADIDTEAEALCDALDGAADTPALETCSRMSSFPHTVEW
jgi:nitrite reductase/ring-hydroxylating ferredoxin subunit